MIEKLNREKNLLRSSVNLKNLDHIECSKKHQTEIEGYLIDIQELKTSVTQLENEVMLMKS